ncbi:tripartite tricarboxylate transporter TctB family protein [Elioraea sp.]|uniref:tripartite tricarboxylate transporter TctB family protein n=1 Tax=Elioraea sp. TaxID=2185103 RepID=UPI0025C26042|nr:tripartite tricarboxylate transporter TctB family protein [Elioraea sp.]
MSQLQSPRNRKFSLGRAAPGLLLAALGIAALAIAQGQPFRLAGGRPGPGFLPALLAGALMGLGVLHALLAASIRRPDQTPDRPQGGSELRVGLALSGAVAAFALLLPWAGFLPAAWATGSLALAAAPGLRPAAVLAGGGVLAGLAAGLFLAGLGLPTPLIGPR